MWAKLDESDGQLKFVEYFVEDDVESEKSEILHDFMHEIKNEMKKAKLKVQKTKELQALMAKQREERENEKIAPLNLDDI